MRFNAKGNLIFIAAIVLASSSLFLSASASPIAREQGIVDVHKRAPAASSSHAATTPHTSATTRAPVTRAVSTSGAAAAATTSKAATSKPASTKAAASSGTPQSRAVTSSSAASHPLPVQSTGISVSAAGAAPSSTQASMNSQAGASVNTGLSTPLIGGIAGVGGVIVVAVGFFAVVRYRKQKELTKKLSSGSNPFTTLGGAPNATPGAASPFPANTPYDRLEDKPLGTFTVISTYTPTLGDELDIQPGDKVTVIVEYDDGWVQGINETRGRLKGVFPKHCVDFGQPAESNRDSMLGGGDKRVKRVSSMYGNNSSYGA